MDETKNILLTPMTKKEQDFTDRILEACSKEAKSSAELLSYTDYKSKNSLMNNIIKPLIEAGLLECTESNIRNKNNKFKKTR